MYALVWTTTPWTLPTNQAIAFSPEIGYSVVQDSSGDRYLLASSVVPHVGSAAGKKFDVVFHMKGRFSIELLFYICALRVTHNMSYSYYIIYY